MKVEVEDLSSVEKKVVVEIPAERVRDEFELAYQEVQKNARIKGFRPGKAPRKMIEQLFKDYVREKVLRKLLEETIEPALDRKQIKPLLEPIVDFGELEADSAFRYTLQVEVRPQVELRQYQGLELERDLVEITEEMVEKAMKNLQEQNAIFQEPKEPRPAREGDLLILDLKAFSQGKPLARFSGTGIQYSLGEEAYIPGLAQELSGISVGEKRTFKVHFPENQPERELAGKEVEYTVELKGLKEKILPDLNDDFAKEVGGCDNLEELKKKIREQLENYYQRISRIRLERNLLDKLVELNPVEVPKRLAERRAESLARAFFKQVGIKDPPKEELEKLIQESLPRAERELKAGYLLEAIIQKEGLTLLAEKEEAKLKELSERYQIDPSKLKDQLGEEALRELRNQWLEEQALDFLISRSKIKDKMVKLEAQESELAKNELNSNRN